MAVEGWKEAPLSEVSTIRKGKKVDTFSEYRAGVLPYIGAESFGGDFKVFTKDSSAVICDPNDILMLWDGEKSGLVATGFNGVVSSTVAKLSPENISSQYLYYFLQSKFSWIQENRTGQAVPHVPKNLKDMLQISTIRAARRTGTLTRQSSTSCSTSGSRSCRKKS